ncbi:MAG: response regulator transcription factor [Chloroflexi bacterium]|nr:response regulator transcription factor [Chloroflexota bacterium]
MARKILVVDDEERMRSLLKAYLTHEGFEVATAVDGHDALHRVRQEPPDLIVLDLMMPGMDGYEFIRRLKLERDIPVIILTARVDEADSVLGLELGADDYVTKPFSPRVLVARIRAVLRRAGMTGPRGDVLQAGDITLDRGTRQVTVGGRDVHLTPSEFDLLATLMESPGRVYSRAELLERVQGVAYEGYERTIDVHIRNLRNKIEPKLGGPRYIETVYGVGYRLAGDLD